MSVLASPSLPWFDRAGRFSALRAAVFAGLCLPALMLLVRAFGDNLGERPLIEAIHVSGDWGARLLVATIAITPLRILSGQSKLIGVRRMIGLAVAAWAFLHVGLYVVDKGGDLAVVASEIAHRPYLTLGFVATVGLGLMAATSWDGAIRRMGSAAWKRLHGLVYGITVLTLVHVFLQSKLDLAQGAILSGIALGGLAIRIATRAGPISGGVAVATAMAAAFAGAVGSEALWFALKTGRSPWPLVAALGDFDARVAPAWIAMGITGAAVVAALVEQARRMRDRPRRA